MTETRVKGKSPLPEAPERWYCRECASLFGAGEYLTAPHPFDDDIVVGCKHCLSIDSLVVACWKCHRPASGGYNNSTEYRYVQACHEHKPQ